MRRHTLTRDILTREINSKPNVIQYSTFFYVTTSVQKHIIQLRRHKKSESDVAPFEGDTPHDELFQSINY